MVLIMSDLPTFQSLFKVNFTFKQKLIAYKNNFCIGLNDSEITALGLPNLKNDINYFTTLNGRDGSKYIVYN